MTDQYEEWKATTVRRPEDVSPATPLVWLAEKESEHARRLLRLRLPARPGHEPGDSGDALAVLALGEAIRRDVETGRGLRVREALELGATWSEVAAALDTAPAKARALLRDWAESQHWLYQHDVEHGRTHPLGIDAEEYAAVLALLELGDDQPAPAAVEGAAR
jgi:hypothetical protein